MWYLDEFINENADWKEKLQGAPYNLTIKEDGDYVLFKYSQLDSDFGSPIVCQARGAIYKKIEGGRLVCVCRPWDKFFNYGEQYAARLDWNREVRISEKIDGSLIKLWWDEGWHWSTNGNINAFTTPTSGDDNMTFGEIICRAAEKLGIRTSSLENVGKSKTHMFELVSPYNKVVIPYELNLYYLQSRDVETGKLGFDEELVQMFPMPHVFKFDDLDGVIAAAASLDWKHEGFVVCDGQNLVKCKSSAYLAAHHKITNGAITLKTLLTVILTNEVSEFLVYCPECAERLSDLQKEIEMAAIYASAAKTEASNWFGLERKDYVSKVIGLTPKRFQDFLFNCYSNHELTWDEYSKGLNWKKWKIILGE